MPGIFLQVIRNNDDFHVRRQLVQPGHQRFPGSKGAAFAGTFPQHDFGDPADPCVLRDRCGRIISIDRGDDCAQAFRHIQMFMNRFFLRVVLHFRIFHIQSDQLRADGSGQPRRPADHIRTGRRRGNTYQDSFPVNALNRHGPHLLQSPTLCIIAHPV